jgi:glucose-6-phosphate 1-epimerase
MLACCVVHPVHAADAEPELLPPEALPACLDRLQPRAAKAGIPAGAFRDLTGRLEADPTVLAALNRQPEFRTPIWDYLAALVDEERIAQGRDRLREWGGTLAAVEQRYGVDPATVVAVWGVESNYGQNFGNRSLLTSLATLSCFGRRQSYFSGEFMALLGLLHGGDIHTDQAYGSWAGAFGHTQFMPSTYVRLAVDFDADGRRDLVGSIPDALASTAHYLDRSGWRAGQPWGAEVKLPAGFDAGLSGRTSRRPLGDWRRMGVVRIDGRPLSTLGDDGARSAVVLPAGIDGPAFVVLRNFDAIYSYNAAESYTFAIALLADRLRGQPGIQAPWPTDDPGLGRSERRELQTLLLQRGHDIGEVDGLIGSRTREAIQAEQRQLGLPADGRAGQKILKALRDAPRPATSSPATRGAGDSSAPKADATAPATD